MKKGTIAVVPNIREAMTEILNLALVVRLLYRSGIIVAKSLLRVRMSTVMSLILYSPVLMMSIT